MFKLFKRNYAIVQRRIDRDVASIPLAQRRFLDDDFRGLKIEIDKLVDGTTKGTSLNFGTLLKCCVSARALHEGIRLHGVIRKSGLDVDTYVGNHLVQMYGSCGQVQEARKVFEGIRHRNIFSWNMMMVAFAQNGHLQDCKFTFDSMQRRDVVSWTVIITAYANNGHPQRALEVFKTMDLEGVQANEVTLLSALDACALVAKVVEGREIHGSLMDSNHWNKNVKLWTAMVSMFGACGKVVDARKVFDRMPGRTVITWNALVSAYAQNGHLEEAKFLLSQMPDTNASSWNAVISGYAQAGRIADAFLHFQMMDLLGMQVDSITVVTILDLCANEACLRIGKLIHSSIVSGVEDEGLGLTGPVKTALLCLYGRCGNLVTARRLFEGMTVQQRGVVAWSAIIAAHAQNGHGGRALELLRDMALEGETPNEITFHSLLCACCNSGLLELARTSFWEMTESYSLRPGLEHFVSMVDLLGKVGRVMEAEELAWTMPFAADVAWTAVLGACKTHGDVLRGRTVAGRVLRINPETSSAYVLLNSMFKT